MVHGPMETAPFLISVGNDCPECKMVGQLGVPTGVKSFMARSLSFYQNSQLLSVYLISYWPPQFFYPNLLPNLVFLPAHRVQEPFDSCLVFLE